MFFRDTCVWAGVDSGREQEKLEATLCEILDSEACRTPQSGSPTRPVLSLSKDRVHAVLAALLTLSGEIDHSKILFLRFSQTQLSQPLELTQYYLCRIPNEQQYSDSDNARENAQPLL